MLFLFRTIKSLLIFGQELTESATVHFETHIILRQFDSRTLGKGQLFVQNMSKCHVKRKQIFISLLLS